MKKKLVLSLGLLGVMTVSMLGGTAFARDHHYNHRGSWGNHYSNNWNRGNWNRGNWGHNNWNRNTSWWGNNNHHRVAYFNHNRPGNRWGNYGHAPRRGGWW